MGWAQVGFGLAWLGVSSPPRTTFNYQLWS